MPFVFIDETTVAPINLSTSSAEASVIVTMETADVSAKDATSCVTMETDQSHPVNNIEIEDQPYMNILALSCEPMKITQPVINSSQHNQIRNQHWSIIV